MRISEVLPESGYLIRVVTTDGRVGIFDVTPYLSSDVFSELKDPNKFSDLFNGGYFIEWGCGADLSADTIEAHWRLDKAAK